MEAKLNSDQRLSLIIETQREISAAGDELHAAMQLIAERSQAIIGADGAMVNLIDGDMLHTRGVSGTAVGAFDARRPVSGSVARFAIGSWPVDPDRGLPERPADRPGDARQGGRPVADLRAAVPWPGGDRNPQRDEQSEEERLTEDDRETLEMISVVLSAAVSRAAEIEARHAQATAISRFRTLFDGASIGILRLDREGLTVEVNPELALMLGVEPEADRRRRASPSTSSASDQAKFETDARGVAVGRAHVLPAGTLLVGASRAPKCGCCCARCWSRHATEIQTARSR